MEEPDRPTGISDEEWAKTQSEADIAQFKNLVEDATVEEDELVDFDEGDWYTEE